ncbi:hypothetical protein IV102_14620 [bacterium]|nr:hypothetical protein [bacterium]
MLELVVAVTVGFALTLMAMDWFTRGGKLAQLLSTRCALQQEALVVCNQICADLARTSKSGLSLRDSATATDPLVLAIHRLFDAPYPGGVFRESQLQVYHWRPAEATLWRKTYPPANPDLGISVVSNAWCVCSPGQLLALASQPNGSARKLCSRLSWLLVSLDPGGVVTVQVRLLDPPLDPKARARCETSRSLYLRNHP